MQKRILIVEDEASIREMVAFALRKADMAVAQAADAREAAHLGDAQLIQTPRRVVGEFAGMRTTGTRQDAGQALA